MKSNGKPQYATPTEWQNYGDVNPEPHGGRFVRWRGDGWELVCTMPWADVCADVDADDGRQMVDTAFVTPRDVFAEGDPSEGLTDRMADILDARSDSAYDPDRYPDMPTDYPPEFFDRLPSYVADFAHRIGGERTEVESGEYAEILAKYGIENWGD